MIRGARAGVTAVVLLYALLPRDAMSAGEVPVDLKLVLAVDASSSMDIYEQKLQRNGYAAAFRSPAVIAAIMSGARRRIAVSYVEWGDPENQIVVVPWTVVDGADSSNQLAARLAAAPLNRFFGTSIAQALAYSTALLSQSAFTSDRWVIDISGDGPNNMGPPVEPERSAALSRGITINGLPIMIRTRWGQGAYTLAGLDDYYRDCVIGGPDAFVVVVRSRDKFAEAIERKLILEIIAVQRTMITPIADTGPADDAVCPADEK
ncbi:MAG: DUF1194 domain-containing protein [Bauldia sp.]|nr:DUF1194 domain-containing protein [Bauldia sp.]